MKTTIGIDAMACHVPRHYIELEDLASARGVEPAKYLKGLGQRQMAIAMPPEDSVYLAAQAARKALESFAVDPAEIGLVVVGTETAVDHAKPISVYLHQALGLRSNCTAFEMKHACFGATAAVSAATDWIASGRARGSKALIVATDIARYGVGTAGEPTQGAGAVAMVISEQPRLVGLSQEIIGEFTANVMDFWRPLYRKEAITDGHYSITCYIDALKGALQDAQPEMPHLDQLDACLYHVPFGSMAKKAHHGHHEFETAAEITRDGPGWDAVQASFEQRTAPWLTLNRDVGNIYTGSLYMALMDLLRQGRLEGGTVSLFSYGSGSVASMRVGQVLEGSARHAGLLDPAAELEARVELTVEEYEEIMQETEHWPGQDDSLNPNSWDLDVSPFMYLGNKDHVRQYAELA